MPALQVRDFPDDLYEQLKAYAASQHRQHRAADLFVAVEQMLEPPTRSIIGTGMTCTAWSGARVTSTSTPSEASRAHREAQGAVRGDRQAAEI